MEVYPADIEGKMQRFFGWLSEKDRRRYAAVEAVNWGMVGSSTSRGSWRASENHSSKASTIWKRQRMRRRGASANRGGRPQRVVAQPTLEANLRQRLHKFLQRSDARRRAVDQSVAARVVATAVGIGSPRQSAHNPSGAAQTQAGPPHGAEEKTMGHHPDRNAQFENIARLRLSMRQPVMRGFRSTRKERITGEFSPERHDLHR